MKNTKKSWKRRKHRNGMRPQRKGSIKINIQEMPSRDEHAKWIEERVFGVNKIPLGKNVSLASNLLWAALEAGKIVNGQLEIPRDHWNKYLEAKAAGDAELAKADQHHQIIKLGQRGYGYFREHIQSNITSIALSAIQDKQPDFHAAPENINGHNYCKICIKSPTCKLLSIDFQSRLMDCRLLVSNWMRRLKAASEGNPLPDQVYNPSDPQPLIDAAHRFLS